MRPHTARIQDYLDECGRVITQINPEEVASLTEAIGEVWQRDALLLICGNGGSASTASHMACDLPKQTRVPGIEPLRAQSLTDNVAVLTAWANDAGFNRVFAEQVNALGRPGDALLCISCSGTSPNIVEAIYAARGREIKVLALGGFEGGSMRDLADIYVHVPSNDYGHVESAHLVLDHCLTAVLRAVAEEKRTASADADPTKPVVIIDRDGVINRNRPDSVKSWDEFEFLPGAKEAIAHLTRRGHRVVVVTNQANIGRGVLAPAQLTEIHRRMEEEILAAGGSIEAIYVCEHQPEDGCDCRKPAPGLLFRASGELGFAVEEAYFIGDHRTDVEAARAAGVQAVLVLSGRESGVVNGDVPGADLVAGDLYAAAKLVTERDMGVRREQAAAG